jgi:hypothetical protein
MAKAPTIKKGEFEAADKKQLRKWCDQYEIAWSKTEDDEAALRRKLQKFTAKLAAVEEEEKEPEAPTSSALPFAGKRAPLGKNGEHLDCFGWFYSAETDLCTKKCPHRAACKPLSAKAPKAGEDAEAEIEAEDEAGAITEDDAEVVRKAHVKKVVKKKAEEPEEEEETEEEPEEEAAESEEDDEEEKPKAKVKTAAKPSIMAKRGVINDDSIVKVNFDEEALGEIDFDGNDGLESFYKRVLKASEKSPSKKVKGSLIKKIVGSALEVEDDALNDVFRDLTRAMLESGELELAR